MLLFPPNPNIGDTLVGPSGQMWAWDGVKWSNALSQAVTVRADTFQGLTTPQQLQARTNIAAAPASGNRELLMSQKVTTAVANLAFFYDFVEGELYEMDFYGIRASTDNQSFNFRCSSNGTNFDIAANYSWVQMYAAGSQTAVGFGTQSGQTYGTLSFGLPGPGNVGGQAIGRTLFSPRNVINKYFSTTSSSLTNTYGIVANMVTSLWLVGSVDLRGINLLVSAGAANFTAGTVNVYHVIGP